MKVTVIESTDNRIKFSVMGINTALANALRRVMIAEIPTLAIDQVEFEKNTTVIPSEMIAHRLGLIPLKNVEDVDPSTIRIALSVKAAQSSDIEVWTSDLFESNNDAVVPAIEGIPIVKANNGQELKLVATVAQGIGRTHSKWAAVATCFFNRTPEGFLFTVESVGGMKPVDIVQKAINILMAKFTGTEELRKFTYHDE